MTETSKATSAVGGTAETSTTQQQAQTAIDKVNRLGELVGNLKRELRTYGEPDSMGRGVATLTGFLSDIHTCEVGIAQAMGIPWDWGTPPGGFASR